MANELKKQLEAERDYLAGICAVKSLQIAKLVTMFGLEGTFPWNIGTDTFWLREAKKATEELDSE